MTSAERHEARYQRRKAKREAKKQQFIEPYDSLDNVTDFANFYEASRLCQRGVNWKHSTQSYCAHRIYNIVDTLVNIKNGKDIRKGLRHFVIYERGKKRNISSVHISERIIQKVVMLNILLPVLSKFLIHDNGASLKGKGIAFAQRRIENHLRKHYRKCRNSGYVLMIDFSSYFDNIRHDIVEEQLLKYFSKEVVDFVMQFIRYEREIGIGLGSEISQILAISYPNMVDHYIKEKLRIHGYGRYMDDSYLICNTKEQAQQCLKELLPLFEQLGIKVNKKKTRIFKLKEGFMFLKTKYILTDSGKIIKRPYKKYITLQRRKLKKLKKMYDRGEIDFQSIYICFHSWRGYMKHKNAYHIIRNMEKLFVELFNLKNIFDKKEFNKL